MWSPSEAAGQRVTWFPRAAGRELKRVASPELRTRVVTGTMNRFEKEAREDRRRGRASNPLIKAGPPLPSVPGRGINVHGHLHRQSAPSPRGTEDELSSGKRRLRLLLR